MHASSDSGPHQQAAVGTVFAGEASEYLEDRLQRSKQSDKPLRGSRTALEMFIFNFKSWFWSDKSKPQAEEPEQRCCLEHDFILPTSWVAYQLRRTLSSLAAQACCWKSRIPLEECGASRIFQVRLGPGTRLQIKQLQWVRQESQEQTICSWEQDLECLTKPFCRKGPPALSLFLLWCSRDQKG